MSETETIFRRVFFMRIRNLFAALTVVVLGAGLIVSCEGVDMNAINEALDKIDGSVYEQAGITKPDTAAIDSAIEAMQTPKTEVVMTPTIGGSESGFGTAVDLARSEGFEALGEYVEFAIVKDAELADKIGKGVLAPQTKEQQAAFQTGIAEALATESGTKVLQTALEQKLDEEESAAVKGSMALASSILSTVSDGAKTTDKLPKEVTDVLDNLSASFADGAKSEGAVKATDKVQMQVVTNLTTNAAALASKMEEMEEPTMDEILEMPEVQDMVNGLFQLADIAELSPSCVNIDINGLLSYLTAGGTN